MKKMEEIANELNLRSESHKIGSLQEIRRTIKGLVRLPTRHIFSAKSIQEDYAFHLGGRTELQFNVGWDNIENKQYLRHGVAFSLEPSQTLPSIEPLIPKVARFNEFIRTYPDELSDFRMWHESDDTRSSNYRVCEIPPDLVCPHVFIFLGRLGSAEQPNYDLILNDFDRLLALYRFVEGTDSFPLLNAEQAKFRFSPGCTVKQTSTVANLPERTLDVNLRHNDIQLLLYEYLVSKYGKNAVGTECDNGAGSRLDVVVKLEERFHIYEIKTSQSARACIREALSQLLEYSFWPGAQEAEQLIVIGEPPLDKDAGEYLSILRSRFALPLRYQQFDVSRQCLVE